MRAFYGRLRGVANQLDLSQEEREEMLPSGRQRVLHDRLHWAKFYMTRAGLIDSPARGRFIAGGAGRALLAKEPAVINVAVLSTIPEFRDWYRQSGEVDEIVQ